MIPALQDRIDDISEACRRHRVARLDVFGSALGDDYERGRSDIDLLVEFCPMSSREKVEAYFGLLEDLRALLDARIDLVMKSAIRNPYVARSIEESRRQVYAA
jgi:uncharacterized protein